MNSSGKRPGLTTPAPPTIRAIFTEAELEKVKEHSAKLPPHRRHLRTPPPPPRPTDQQRAERASAQERHEALKDLRASLRRRREQLGLSLEAVAQRCGMNRAALSKLELGQNANPTFETLWRCAVALGQQLRCELGASGSAHEAQAGPEI